MNENTPEEVPTIEFDDKHDKIPCEKIKCPHCSDRYMIRVPYVHASCSKCGTRFITDFNMGIYNKWAKAIDDLLGWRKGVKIRAHEPYHAEFTHLIINHQRQKCWDVSDIEEEVEEHKRCKKCGVCLNCFTCKSCGKTFEKDSRMRRQQCPHCRSPDFVQTYFKEAEEDKNNKMIKRCPCCKADKIVMTRTQTKTKCHLCGSKELSEPIVNRILSATIMKKKAYQ